MMEMESLELASLSPGRKKCEGVNRLHRQPGLEPAGSRATGVAAEAAGLIPDIGRPRYFEA